MPDRNEHTSEEVASLAARIVKASDIEVAAIALLHPDIIRSIAASALTQARDHAEK